MDPLANLFERLRLRCVDATSCSTHAPRGRATMRLMRTLLLLLAAGTATAQTTWIVEAGNPTALPTLAAAVTAAVDGDTIVIRHAGEWVVGPILLTKSLRIIGNTATGGAPSLAFFAGGLFGVGGLDIQIAAGKELVLANCSLHSFVSPPSPVPSVNISSSVGRVTLQDITGFFALTIAQSQQVLLSRLDFMAAAPIAITGSVVALDRCRVRGRNGDFETSRPAAQAMQLDNATVHGMDTIIRGGDAAWHAFGYEPSMPGTRALTANSSTLTLSGAASSVASGVLYTGSPSESFQSSFVFHPGLQPAIGGTSTVATRILPVVAAVGFASGGNAQLTVDAPGLLTALVFGVPGDRIAIPGVSGDLWIDPQDYCIASVGFGSAVWAVTVPPAPVMFGKVYRWQGLALSQGLEFGAPGSALLR